jgi:hypothetical protein
VLLNAFLQQLQYQELLHERKTCCSDDLICCVDVVLVSGHDRELNRPRNRENRSRGEDGLYSEDANDKHMTDSIRQLS